MIVINNPADLLCEALACEEEQQLQECDGGSYFCGSPAQQYDPSPAHHCLLMAFVASSVEVPSA